jgi:hypothetical protein
MNNNEITVKWWSESLQVGLNDIKTCIGIVSGEVVRYKVEVNNGTLRYRHIKKVVSYLSLKRSITHKNYKIKEYCPF